MSGKGEHLEYISRRGLFHIDSDTTMFTREEIEIIEKWGHWFAGLITGELQPFTEAQERFIRVVNGELTPATLEEVAWLKYKERTAANKQDVNKPTVGSTTMKERIYTRRHKKKSKGEDYNPISWNRRRGTSEE